MITRSSVNKVTHVLDDYMNAAAEAQVQMRADIEPAG